MTVAGEQIVRAVRTWRTAAAEPLVVAIDGHGAAGKTTIAAEVASALDAVTLHTDDHFHAARPGSDPRPMSQYYDWHELRATGLEPAIARRPALILVEGVSSAGPALADLVARSIFVQTPEPVRLERLHGRVSDEEWDEDWLAAERVYFASRPPETFDLVVRGAA